MQNQQDKISDIYKDFRMIKDAVAPDEKESVFDEIVPIYGSLSNIEEEVENKNFDTAGAITSLAVLKGPEEIDELFSATNQIKHNFRGKKYNHPYDYTKAEIESSFFRDSTLAKHMNYRSKDCVFPKISSWLLKKDKSMLGTKLGNFIRKLLGIEFNTVETPLESITSTPEFRTFLEAVDFNGNSLPKEIVGRSLARTSTLGSLALATIEGLDIKNDIQDGAEPLKEITKGFLKIGTTISSIGIFGAIGSKYLGPVGSVIGVATGTALSALVARNID